MRLSSKRQLAVYSKSPKLRTLILNKLKKYSKDQLQAVGEEVRIALGDAFPVHPDA
jgi:hypothetical protein